jgi:PilZ domain-containing protein
MDALNEIIRFLDRHTGFAEDLEALVESPQWPTGWLTAHQIAQEVDRFRFWDGLRNRVPAQTRPLLLDQYLRETAADDDTGWVCIDDQFKLRPGENDIDNGEAKDPDEKQNRRHGRVQCEMLTCSLGEIVNLSASGVMIRGKGTFDNDADSRANLDLKCLDHELSVTARVAWIQQESRSFQVGMEFIDITAEQAQRIRDLLPIAAAVQAVSDSPHSGHVTNWGK